MKIYTKTGDDGSTGLLGGQRVPKSDPRIACTGEIDELNAALGWAAVVCDPQLSEMLQAVQNDLFVIGSHLSAPDPASAGGLPTLDETMIGRLEMQIDSAETQLPPLRNFILPGGSELAARLHLSRTICRRAERVLVDVSQDRPLPLHVMTYLNRLSDWLFVQARWSNKRAGVEDIPWKP